MATREIQTDEGDELLDKDTVKAKTGFKYTFKQVLKDPTASVGLVIVSIAITIATFATIDAQLLDYHFAETYWYHPERDPEQVQPLLPPAGFENTYGSGVWDHPLGTDHRGRDILVRLFYGTRIAIQVGILATGLGMFLGIIVGAVAGYYGGWVDDVLMRLAETVYAIPFLILVIAFMAVFGRDIVFALIGVSIVSVPTFSRLIRSKVLSIREQMYVEAARASGVKDRYIILKHVIPNSFAPVIIEGTLRVGGNILLVAGLSFLGFGAQPPTPSWGQMLAESRGVMLTNAWYSLWPGLCILITVVGFNLIGDGLQDVLEPKIEN